MIGRTALLSSTAIPASHPPSYGIVANDTPHTLTKEDLLQAIHKMIENDQKPRPHWPSPEEIQRLSRQPIPTEAETRKAELEKWLTSDVTWSIGYYDAIEQFETYRWKQIGLITDFMLGPAPPLTSRRK